MEENKEGKEEDYVLHSNGDNCDKGIYIYIPKIRTHRDRCQ